MGEGVTEKLVPSEQLNGTNSKKKTGPKKKSDAEVDSQIAMGLRLRERRLKLKLSLVEVAKAIGVSAARYYNWEERFGPLPRSRYLDILAKVLGTHPSWIRTGEVQSFNEEANGTSIPPLALQSDKLEKSEREYFGKRAKKRRDYLKLKAVEVAEFIGINSSKLGMWERCLPAFPDVVIDAKWEQVVQAPTGWLRNKSIIASVIDHTSTSSFVPKAGKASFASEIRSIGCWLVRESVTKRTSEYHLLNERERRGADIFALRYGVEGEEAATLQAIGDRFGITRERARQIASKMEYRKGNFIGKTPSLDLLQSEIRKILPAPVEEIDIEFRELLGESLSIENAERFAREVLGHSIVALTEKSTNPTLGYGTLAIDPKTHDPEVIRVCRDVALTMIRSSGAAQISFVAGEASSVSKRGVSVQECGLACKLVAGFEWLVEEDGWFWFGPKWENRLLTVARKVLAVANRKVDIEDIQGAMSRSRRSNYQADKHRPYAIDAPYWVMGEVLKRVCWLKVIQFDDFQLVEPVAIESVLSEVELAVTKIAQANGGVVARYTLTKELLDPEIASFSAVGLHAALDASPIFYRLDAGIFALRGSAIRPEALAKASSAVGGTFQHMRNHQIPTADAEGFLSIKFELKPYVVNSRYFEMPSRIAHLIPKGEYQVDGFYEKVKYNISPSGACRLNKFASKLIKMGFVAGDWVKLLVNPKSKVMQFHKTTAEIIET